MRISVQLADGVNFIPVPVACKINSMMGVANATPGTTATATIVTGATALGVITLSGATVGIAAVGIANATTGRETVVAGGCIKITCVSTNDVGMGVTLDLDEFLVG
jgi:hypothetical protein